MPSRTSHARSVASVQSMTLQRGLVLGVVMTAWMLTLIGRLYHLQIIQYVDLVARGERQQQRTIEIAPTRGTIFDRQMQPLAMSLAVDSVFAVPAEIPNPDMVADLIGPVLGIEKGDLLAKFKAFKTFCALLRWSRGFQLLTRRRTKATLARRNSAGRWGAQASQSGSAGGAKNGTASASGVGVADAGGGSVAAGGSCSTRAMASW